MVCGAWGAVAIDVGSAALVEDCERLDRVKAPVMRI